MASVCIVKDTTPKKVYSRTGRKEKPISVDDCCRLCDCSLKNKYGSIGSFVNLFKPSQRGKLQGKILASLCLEIGITVEKDTDFSSRVCPPCFRKIKNCSELYSFISSKCAITKSFLHSQLVVKRQLPTTLTPNRNLSASRKLRTESPEHYQSEKVSQQSKSRRKSLFQVREGEEDELHNDSSDKNNLANKTSAESDNVLSHLNIDDIIDTKTIVKVVILSPNGNVTVRTPRNRKTTNLVKNLVLHNWSTVANAVVSHDDIIPHLQVALNRKVNNEFKSYVKSETVLKGREPDELVSFSNKLVVKEAELYLPFWNACVHGACGSSGQSNALYFINPIALTTAVAARERNKELSAFHYRISTVLFHSGVSYDGTTRLNRLEICMSPQRMVAAQRKMGKHYDSKVLVWKRSIEENEKAVLLLSEVKSKQLTPLADDDMEIERVVDIGTTNVGQGYKYFDENILKYCQSLALNKPQAPCSECPITEEKLYEMITLLKHKKLPYYK